MSEDENILTEPVIKVLLLVLTVILISPFVWNQMNNATKWSSFTINEITSALNLAEPGDQLEIDLYQATKIAGRNNQKDLQKIVSIDDEKNEVCISLSEKSKTCANYFNNVKIKSYAIISGAARESERNTLVIELDKEVAA